MEVKVGHKIWRRSALNRPHDENIFTKQSDNSYMFRTARVQFHKEGDNALCAVNHTHEHGLVCFCKKDIPAKWIYFVVTGLSKNGKAAFVEPVVGTDEELESQYSIPALPKEVNSDLKEALKKPEIL